MNAFEEAIDFVIGLWAYILFFITCPLWGVPYILYQIVKNRRKG